MLRNSCGFLFMAAGVATGLVTYFPSCVEEAGSAAGSAFTMSTALALEASLAERDRIASFSPGRQLLSRLEDTSDQRMTMSPLEFFASKMAKLQAASNTTVPLENVELSPWRGAVVAEPIGLGLDGGETNPTRLGPAQKQELATAIQRELTRIGCYHGEIDGNWGGASKRALATFLDRVNAALPIVEPDFVLLTLARAQPAGTCGETCPTGQNFDDEDRCVPNSILAQATKRRSSPKPTQITQRKPVTPLVNVASAEPKSLPQPLPGRMEIGGPKTASLLESDGSPATIETNTARVEVTSANVAADARPPVPASRQKTNVTLANRRADKPKADKLTISGRPTRTIRVTGYNAVKHLFEDPLGRL
ncbi:MAG: hypothetical protein WC807_15725 [Hyphomicrobium sp.]|jgi:hypothetical protein